MGSLWRYLLAGLGLAVLVVGVLAVVYHTVPAGQVANGRDLSRSKTTVGGLFLASIAPESGVIKQGELHSWRLTLTTKAGVPVENAAIDVSGGMPQHNHGLPTSPQVTDYLGAGNYRIEGLKFTMSGWWQLRVGISAAAGSDSVVFNIVL